MCTHSLEELGKEKVGRHEDHRVHEGANGEEECRSIPHQSLRAVRSVTDPNLIILVTYRRYDSITLSAERVYYAEYKQHTTADNRSVG